jgi:hypothetical protein
LGEHKKFEGQRQGGISTPAKHGVIFLFTGSSGVKHGYSDEWTAEGTYRYYGEGQKGDMTLQRGKPLLSMLPMETICCCSEHSGVGRCAFWGRLIAPDIKLKKDVTAPVSRGRLLFST